MRLIGHLENQRLAEQVSRVLISRGIRNQVEAEPEDGPSWALWIHSEEDLDRARRLLKDFRANPDDPAFHMAGAGAPRQETPPARAPEVRTRRSQPVTSSPSFAGPPLVTVAFMLLCIAVAFITRLGESGSFVAHLQISEVPYRFGMGWELFLPEARRGEVWRLITPILLHFGWPHLLFNLWILWDLGQVLEHRQGPGRLVLLTTVIGVVSNLSQYIVSGPRFGGFSGVIYGLLGYVWMMGRYCPSAGMGLHPQTVVMMLVWFVICLSNVLPMPVANVVHGVGLVMGVVWGRLEAARQAR